MIALTPAQAEALRGILSAAELRLFDYLANGGDPGIMEIWRICRITPRHLLFNVYPGLCAKIAAIHEEIPA